MDSFDKEGEFSGWLMLAAFVALFAILALQLINGGSLWTLHWE